MAPPTDCACWKILLTFFVGICFTVLGILSIPFLNKFVRQKVEQDVPLREPHRNGSISSGTPNVAYRFWKDIPVPMYVAFRFFHVENPLEVTNLGEKPLLKEKGPYVYSETRHKKDIVFSPNGSVVSFREESVFHFIPEMSAKGGEDEELRLLNVPFLTVLNKAQYQGYWKRKALEIAVSTTKTSLFETKTARDWIWGYDDPLLQLIKLTDPDMVPFTFFGWFMNRNNSDTGGLSIRTGVDDTSREAQILSWKNETSLDVWADSYCNAINGTDGTMFHPFVEKNETLYMFSVDICRSIYARFEREVTVKGLRAYKFVPPAVVFGNLSVNPDNACFCVPDLDHCLGAGVLNISQCQFGAPVVSSSPHLFQADPSYLNNLKGLHPSKQKHQTYLYVEPLTGMVLGAAKRLQVNAWVENIAIWETYFQKFPDKILFPVMWVEESAVLDDATAATMRGQVTDQLHLVLAIQVTLFVFGGFAICVAVLLVTDKVLYRRRLKTPPPLERVQSKPASLSISVSYDNPGCKSHPYDDDDGGVDQHSPIHEDKRRPMSYGAIDAADASSSGAHDASSDAHASASDVHASDAHASAVQASHDDAYLTGSGLGEESNSINF